MSGKVEWKYRTAEHETIGMIVKGLRALPVMEAQNFLVQIQNDPLFTDIAEYLDAHDAESQAIDNVLDRLRIRDTESSFQVEADCVIEKMTNKYHYAYGVAIVGKDGKKVKSSGETTTDEMFNSLATAKRQYKADIIKSVTDYVNDEMELGFE